jgi:hypothetical protein
MDYLHLLVPVRVVALVLLLLKLLRYVLSLSKTAVCCILYDPVYMLPLVVHSTFVGLLAYVVESTVYTRTIRHTHVDCIQLHMYLLLHITAVFVTDLHVTVVFVTATAYYNCQGEEGREEVRLKKNVNRSLQRLKEQIKAERAAKRLLRESNAKSSNAKSSNGTAATAAAAAKVSTVTLHQY